MVKIKTLCSIFCVLAIVLVGIFFVFRNASIIESVINEQSTSLASVLPSVIIALTNTDRVKNGSSLLVENPLLTKAAQIKADDMLARQYYSHTTPEGHTPLYFLDAVGYKYLNAGENLDLTYESTAEDVHMAWMNSPAHRANLLLSQYTEIGVGVAEGEYQGQHVSFVVELFGTPLPPAPLAPILERSVKTMKVPTSLPTPSIQQKTTVTSVAEPIKQSTRAFVPIIPVSAPTSVQTSLETFISTSTEALPPVLERVLAENASSSSFVPNLILSASSTAGAMELLTLFNQSENPLQASLRSFIRGFKNLAREIFLRIYLGASFRDQQQKAPAP